MCIRDRHIQEIKINNNFQNTSFSLDISRPINALHNVVAETLININNENVPLKNNIALKLMQVQYIILINSIIPNIIFPK